MRPFQFDLSTIPEHDLGRLGNWLMSRFTTYPAFAPWLAELLGGEALLRQEGKTGGDYNHYLPPHWTDLDVADALEGITLLSFAENIDQTTGRFLDKVVIHVAALAASRLRDRDAIARSIKGN